MYYRYEMGFGSPITPAVKKLILINVSVFAGQFIFSAFFNVRLELLFGLVPALVTGKLFVWQLGTYMFLHSTGSLFHILLNMFALWIFGCEIERHWGTRDFYIYYFVTGIGAGIFSVIFEATSPIPIVGASGAIYGLLLAFGMMFPERPIYLYFLFPIRAKYFVLIFGTIAFISAFSARSDGIAHFAHLGGMVVGYLFLRLDWRLEGLVKKFPSLFKQGRPDMKIHRRKKPDNGDLRNRIDEILDKINEVGYENITEEEREILRKASQYYVNRGRDIH
ncbi:rhomboid family intramembrane serine protease [candidate division KSB1 bacterium]